MAVKTAQVSVQQTAVLLNPFTETDADGSSNVALRKYGYTLKLSLSAPVIIGGDNQVVTTGNPPNHATPGHKGNTLEAGVHVWDNVHVGDDIYGILASGTVVVEATAIGV
jgi:hypothetical protein